MSCATKHSEIMKAYDEILDNNRHNLKKFVNIEYDTLIKYYNSKAFKKYSEKLRQWLTTKKRLSVNQ
jgi:hypothetical protein